MRKIHISLLKTVNDVPFSSTKAKVREVFGPDFREPENHLNDPGMKEFLNWVDEQFSEMSGRPIEEFKKYDTDDDFDDNYDSYDEFRIEYNRDNQFEAIEIYADKKVKLIVDDKDCSDFSVEKLKTLADDFEWDSDNTAWTSYSKQIGIWCPNGKNTVECVLFGKPGYYTDNSKLPF